MNCLFTSYKCIGPLYFAAQKYRYDDRLTWESLCHSHMASACLAGQTGFRQREVRHAVRLINFPNKNRELMTKKRFDELSWWWEFRNIFTNTEKDTVITFRKDFN